jgi:SARP family transcriptional regulator, regulator of embCAB operon
MTLGSARTRIQLCGRLVVELDGRRIEDALPGRQGRLLFGYLATERVRPAHRETLIELLWPGKPAGSGDLSLRPLISRLRHILGDRLAGRSELRLLLPTDARVDIERAARYLHDAESAVSLQRWRDAWMPAQIGWSITSREFLPGCEGEWVEDRRRRLDDDHLRALQCIAMAGLHLGPAELPDAERAARSLIELAPYRESGYGLLMEALELRGDIAEALLVHDLLRRVLREELGLAPSQEVQHLVERLLTRR